MRTALKPYATVGVAIVGASFLAVTPVAAPSPDLPAVRDVALTADGSPFGDFLAPWIDQYNTAGANATQLVNNFFMAPGVGLQQAIANQADFWQQLADDPSKLADVTLQMQDNVKAVLDSFTLLDADEDTVATVTSHTLSGVGGALGSQHGLFGLLPSLLPGFLPDNVDPDMVTSILNFLASPASGIIIGALGPSLSPWVALTNSINDGDSFNEIMANMVGAYFNGATLNLDSLLPAINDAGVLPSGMGLDHLEFALGGLLTPGDVNAADLQIYDTNGDSVVAVPQVGGSIFNSLGLDLTGVPLLGSLGFDGHAVGPLGAWEAFSQAIAALLGADAWAYDGKGDPPAAVPPLTGASFPTLPDDLFDDGGATNEAASAAAELAGSLDPSDVAAAFGF